MSKNITYIIYTLLIIALTLLGIVGIWIWEDNHDPQLMDVQQAFNDIEDYPYWTDAELERIIERRNFLIQCEENIAKADKALVLYGRHVEDQKDFIEEYGE